MPKPVFVDAHLDARPPLARALIDEVRALFRACLPGKTEGVKWNAPSYAPAGGEDRLTPIRKLQRQSATELAKAD